MATIALLFAEGDAPLGALHVAGTSVLDRQLRQLRYAGIEAIVVGGGMPSAGFDAVADAGALRHRLADDDQVLVLAPGLVVDERIVSAILAATAPVVATWSIAGPGPQCGIERLDPMSFAAGVAVYPGGLVRQVAAHLGEWDLQATLLRAALAEPGATRLDLGALPLYDAGRRRDLPLSWARPADADEAAAATSMLLAAAQKGCLDWPARYLHPPIENVLVRLLLPTSITPNQVTIFVAVLAVVAGVAFATGWLWTGLLLALATGPLDGVDGKLARTKLVFSRWGELEHLLDKISEYGWFLCIAAHLSIAEGNAGPWAVAALIVLFALAESLQNEFFRRFTGTMLDEVGGFERGFRLVSGRRNTFFWTLVPFALFGHWYVGFVTVAIYSVVTYFILQFRFIVRMTAYGRANAPAIEANFARTAYGFLPKRTEKTAAEVIGGPASVRHGKGI